jgi:hypothetical protein
MLKENIVQIENLDDDNAGVVIENSNVIAFKNYKKTILKALIGKSDFDPEDNIPDYRIDTMMLSVLMFEL